MNLSKIDSAVFDQFADVMGEDFADVMEGYLALMPESFSAAKRAAQQADAKALRLEVHSIKSNAKQIGAMNMAQLAQDVERAAAQEDTTSAEAALNSMETAWLEIAASIRARIA